VQAYTRKVENLKQWVDIFEGGGKNERGLGMKQCASKKLEKNLEQAHDAVSCTIGVNYGYVAA
jgi:hypothetical protein